MKVPGRCVDLPRAPVRVGTVAEGDERRNENGKAENGCSKSEVHNVDLLRRAQGQRPLGWYLNFSDVSSAWAVVRS